MYKKLCCLALAAFLTPVLLSAEDYDQLPVQKDRKYYRLKGNVVQVSEQSWAPPQDTTVYSTASGPVAVGQRYILQRTEETAFNDKGDIQSLTITALRDEKKKDMQTTLRRFYYTKDQLTAMGNTLEGKPGDSATFHYRKHGLLDQYSLYNGKGLQYKVTYIYKSGKMFTARKNNQENVPVSMTRYKYKDGRLVETQHFGEQYQLSETRRYSLQRTADGLFNNSYSVSGADGRMSSGLSQVKDSLGNILEQSFINGDREVTEYHRFRYDAQSFPVEEKVFAYALEETIESRYTYDGQGNWTRKEIFTNGILTAVVLRAIKYAG